MIFLELFLTFFKIGAFPFGGGYAMLPFIQEETIARGWATEEQLTNFIAVSESTPGPFAVNMATYIGSQQGALAGGEGWMSVLLSLFGAFCATLGVVLPSFIVILIVAKCYEQFKNSRIVKGCMSGLKPAVVGLIASAVLTVAATVFIPEAGFSAAIFKDVFTYVSLGISAISLVLAFKKVHPILIICMSAVLGIASGYLL
jgi:chromate transporter